MAVSVIFSPPLSYRLVRLSMASSTLSPPRTLTESLLPELFRQGIGGLSARLLFASSKFFVCVVYTGLGQSGPVKAPAAELTAGSLKEWSESVLQF